MDLFNSRGIYFCNDFGSYRSLNLGLPLIHDGHCSYKTKHDRYYSYKAIHDGYFSCKIIHVDDDPTIQIDDDYNEVEAKHSFFSANESSLYKKFDIASIPIMFRKKRYNINQYQHHSKIYCSGDKRRIIKMLSYKFEAAYPKNIEFKDKMSYDIDDCVNKCDINFDEYTCSICTMIFNDPIKLNCGHGFCTLCLSQIKKRACPMCRQPFTYYEPKKDVIKYHILNIVMVNCGRCLSEHSINDQCFERNPLIKCKKCVAEIPLLDIHSHFVSCFMKRCHSCSLSILNDDLINHQLKCAERKQESRELREIIVISEFLNSIKLNESNKLIESNKSILSAKCYKKRALKNERINQKKEIAKHYKNMRSHQKHDKYNKYNKHNKHCFH